MTVSVRVRRVWWWTDWARGVRAALRELWRSFFGCHHRWATIRFQHVVRDGHGLGFWAVNRCDKCGATVVHGTWSGR